MKDGPDIAMTASLIGDPGRANMLTALMAGRALTASELAAEAGVGRSTASGHLAALQAGGLVTLRKQGRHRYATLACDEVAQVLELLMGIAAGRGRLRTRTGPRDGAMRHARVCYNHLAGERGTQLLDAMLVAGQLRRDGEGLLDLTAAGEVLLAGMGLGPGDLGRGRAPLCRECLDWSERRSHLGGRLGRAMLARMEAQGWLARVTDSRVLRFTPTGARAFDAAFQPPMRRVQP